MRAQYLEGEKWRSAKSKFLSGAMRSCMADGGKPSDDGLQEQSSNRPELHMLRACVVSVMEKALQDEVRCG